MTRVKMVVLIGLAVIGAVYAGTRPETMTREQKNKLLVEVAIGAMNAGDFEALKELYSPKFIQHQPGNEKKIRWAGFELGCRIVKQKMPTIRYEVEDIIAEGDKVALRLKAIVTYKETYITGNRGAGKVEFTEMDMFRIKDGRIAEEWCEYDTVDWEKKMHKLRAVKKWR